MEKKDNTEPAKDGDQSGDNKQSELVSNASQQRNWRGIVIALLVILIVCALIVTAVIIATPDEDSDGMGEKFTFGDFLENPDYKPRSFRANWIEGKNLFYYHNHYGELRMFNCTTNTSELLVDNSTMRHTEPEIVQMSSDERYLLLRHNVKEVFRHSTVADYHVYDLKTHNPIEVTPPDPKYPLQYAAFAPVGYSMVIVQQYNIFYKESFDSNAEPLTVNGDLNMIYNGVPDWVYEEEVLSKDHALWWSKGATYLLYATFNDTSVDKFEFPQYGDMSQAYTDTIRIAYPKPGTSNPTITLNIVRPDVKTKITLSPPSELSSDYLFTSVVWRNDEEVLITWMNRIQNRAVVTLCHAVEGRCKKSQDIKSVKGWLEPANYPVFMPDGSHYFWILPQREGDAGSYKHIAMVEIRNGTLKDRRTYLTNGKWEVTSIKEFDPVNRTLYFTSPKNDARQMHLFSVSIDTKKVTCETCEMDKVNCLYNTVTMASTSDYYMLECAGPGVPTYTLMSREGMEVKIMENNTYFKELITKKALPQVVYEQVEMKDGTKLWAKLLLPPQLKREEILKYPLVLFQYGGPGTQQVKMKYNIDWETYMVSSRDVIYAFVDGRGTAGRGDKFLHAVYRNFGGPEVDDTIEAANYFAKLHYVDQNKMAIWGWISHCDAIKLLPELEMHDRDNSIDENYKTQDFGSSYGGYLTAAVLGRPKKPFKCGISVAPVSDWMYYDSIYTERYMGLPKNNMEGYRKGNVSQYASNFKNISFMLVHGTGDDNVHFQHSAQLVKALTEADIYFRFQMYTDHEHMLSGGNTRRHLYESMEDFLVECFEGYSEKFGRVAAPSEE